MYKKRAIELVLSDQETDGRRVDAQYLDYLHPLDRHRQQEAYEFALNSDKKYIIIHAPTGIGKSALAAYLSLTHRVLALTKEKALQDANYLNSYHFDVLKGKGNYPCGYNGDYTAEICGIDHEPKQGDEAIPVNVLKGINCKAGLCPYQTQKAKLLGSMRGSLNYTKFLLEPDQEWNKPEFLVCDEAHQLIDLVLEFSSFSVKYSNKFLSGFDPIPFFNHRGAMYVIGELADHIKSVEPGDDTSREHVEWSRLSNRLNYCMTLIEKSEANDELDSWFFSSDDEGMIIKPMTAKHNFKRMFHSRGEKIVFFSATIGPWITDALGIGKDEYDYLEIESPYPPQDRPVYYFKDMPRMSYRLTSNPNGQAVVRQCKIVSSVVNRRKDQSHIVLTNSTSHAKSLYTTLRRMGVDAYMSRADGTEGKMADWDRNRRPGRVLISYSFWEGVNLERDYSIMVAKVPFPPMGSEGSFENAKFKYSKTLWHVYAALKFIQGIGRNRRGDETHYGKDETGRLNRLVMVIDGNWTRIKGKLPKDIKESMVEVDDSFKIVNS